jgi:phage anti-repressor protein
MNEETFNITEYEQADNEDGFIVSFSGVKNKSQEQINSEARKFLKDTDWLVIRHQDQINAGVETSLSQEQYNNLFQQRDLARNIIT